MRSEDGEIIIPERDIRSEAEACLAIIEPMLPIDPEGYTLEYRVVLDPATEWRMGRSALELFRPDLPDPPTLRWWQRAPKIEHPKVIAREKIDWNASDPNSVPNGLEEAAARITVRLTVKALREVEQ